MTLKSPADMWDLPSWVRHDTLYNDLGMRKLKQVNSITPNRLCEQQFSSASHTDQLFVQHHETNFNLYV